LKAATAIVGEFYKVVTAFVERGKQLQGYSADLSMANARASITSTLADIREAQELGPALARLTDAKTDFDLALRELLLPIKKAVVEIMVPILQTMTHMVENVSDQMKLLADIGEIVSDVLLGGKDSNTSLLEVVQKIFEFITRTKRDKTITSLIGENQIRAFFEGRNFLDPHYNPDPVLGTGGGGSY